jgi:hypothetical protein
MSLISTTVWDQVAWAIVVLRPLGEGSRGSALFLSMKDDFALYVSGSHNSLGSYSAATIWSVDANVPLTEIVLGKK